MAGSVNKVILVGNLGADPEVRQTQDGRPIVNLRVATSDSWRDKATGERREKTEWHRVVIFNENIAKVAEKYLHKGSKVYLEGAIQTRKWTNKDNQEQYSTEIVLQKFRGELLQGRPSWQDAPTRTLILRIGLPSKPRIEETEGRRDKDVPFVARLQLLVS